MRVIPPALPRLMDMRPVWRFLRDALLLRFSVKAWHNHKIMTKWVQKLFQHLDRGYVLNTQTETITSCSMKKFLEVRLFFSACASVTRDVTVWTGGRPAGWIW